MLVGVATGRFDMCIYCAGGQGGREEAVSLEHAMGPVDAAVSAPAGDRVGWDVASAGDAEAGWATRQQTRRVRGCAEARQEKQ